MNFIQDFIAEINKLPLYDNVDKEGHQVKTIEVGLVCDLLTVLIDKHGLEERIYDDLYG